MRGLWWGAGALTIGLLGCGGESGRAGTMVVRDSAGVALVEHEAAALATAPRFRLDAPIYRMADTDSLHPAAMIRTAALVGGGHFVALDSRVSRVILYDSTGAVHGTFGRRGSGPGALNAPSTLRALSGGVVQLVDFPARVIQLGASDLQVLRESQVGPSEPVVATVLQQLAPGIAIAVENSTAGGSATQQLLRLSRSGVDTLATWPGTAAAEFSQPVLARPWGGSIVTSRTGWSFAVRDTTGALRRVVTIREPAVAVTAAMRDAALAGQRQTLQTLAEDDPEGMAEALAALDRTVFADSLPAYDDLLESRDGSLWVGSYVVRGAAERQYVVFAETGELLRRVALPASQRVIAADGDLVLVRGTDAQGQVHLDLARLVAAEP